ncbi:MAG TPA: DUF1015 domain-containing protein [Terriglobia bacterium]|nr:DUF1015 domain-containing protein [Terriglobia bacterium]
MAEICPFRALHYNPQRIPDLSKVITQPYDKISPKMQSRYYSLSPYNLVRIIRGQESPQDSAADNVYTRATRDFKDWIQNQILISEQQPALYAYSQEYALPGEPGARRERRGFIALCKIEDYSARIVHRHEETLSGPKADRMELLKRTKAHFGQVFFLYSDPEGVVEKALSAATQGAAWEQLIDEYETRHTVWRVSEPSTIERMTQRMRDKKLVIADGHHRYETALAYRNLMRAEPGYDQRVEYVMATFIRMETDGLTILPTHRVIHSLESFDRAQFAEAARKAFDWKEVDASRALADGGKGLQQALAEGGNKRPTIAVYAGAGKLALLSLRQDYDLARALPELSPLQRRLDVVVLHRLLIERALGISPEAVRDERNIHYLRGLSNAVAEVDSGRAQLCFLMNPTPIEAVRDVALAGEVMPQKSTDFYPKLLSGLTIYWLENPLGI